MNTAFTLLQSNFEAQPEANTTTGLRHWFARAGNALWRALAAIGRARAQRHLLAFVDQCESQQPELAKELRAYARQGPLA